MKSKVFFIIVFMIGLLFTCCVSYSEQMGDNPTISTDGVHNDFSITGFSEGFFKFTDGEHPYYVNSESAVPVVEAMIVGIGSVVGNSDTDSGDSLDQNFDKKINFSGSTLKIDDNTPALRAIFNYKQTIAGERVVGLKDGVDFDTLFSAIIKDGRTLIRYENYGDEYNNWEDSNGRTPEETEYYNSMLNANSCEVILKSLKAIKERTCKDEFYYSGARDSNGNFFTGSDAVASYIKVGDFSTNFECGALNRAIDKIVDILEDTKIENDNKCKELEKSGKIDSHVTDLKDNIDKQTTEIMDDIIDRYDQLYDYAKYYKIGFNDITTRRKTWF